MDYKFWPLATLAIIIVIFIVMLIARYRHKEYKTDYFALFLLGIFWMILGLPEKNYSLSVLGFVFFAIGLAKKNKWKENHRSWSELTVEEKRFKLILIAIVSILLLAGVGILTMRQLNGGN